MDDDMEDEIICELFTAHAHILWRYLGVTTSGFAEIILPGPGESFKSKMFQPGPFMFLIFVAVILSVVVQSCGQYIKHYLHQINNALGMDRLVELSTCVPGSVSTMSQTFTEGIVGVYALQGRRGNMEDRFSIVQDVDVGGNKKISFFGVYDGHGGQFVAEYVRQHLVTDTVAKLKSLLRDKSNSIPEKQSQTNQQSNGMNNSKAKINNKDKSNNNNNNTSNYTQNFGLKRQPSIGNDVDKKTTTTTTTAALGLDAKVDEIKAAIISYSDTDKNDKNGSNDQNFTNSKGENKSGKNIEDKNEVIDSKKKTNNGSLNRSNSNTSNNGSLSRSNSTNSNNGSLNRSNSTSSNNGDGRRNSTQSIISERRDSIDSVVNGRKGSTASIESIICQDTNNDCISNNNDTPLKKDDTYNSINIRKCSLAAVKEAGCSNTNRKDKKDDQGSQQSIYVDGHRNVNYTKFLTDQIIEMDKKVVTRCKSLTDISGSTAVVALLDGELLVVGNVGDSRAVMGDTKGAAIPLSYDHKPNQLKERRRIKEAGGFITFTGVWRVAGILATSRALGDFPLKDPRRLITAEPDVLTFSLRDHKAQFIILATDGLWDVLSNEEAVAYIRLHLHESDYGAKSLSHHAYLLGSQDNITVTIINIMKLKL